MLVAAAHHAPCLHLINATRASRKAKPGMSQKQVEIAKSEMSKKNSEASQNLLFFRVTVAMKLQEVMPANH